MLQLVDEPSPPTFSTPIHFKSEKEVNKYLLLPQAPDGNKLISLANGVPPAVIFSACRGELFQPMPESHAFYVTTPEEEEKFRPRKRKLRFQPIRR